MSDCTINARNFFRLSNRVNTIRIQTNPNQNQYFCEHVPGPCVLFLFLPRGYHQSNPLLSLSSLLDTLRKLTEYLFGGLPIDASIRNTDTLLQTRLAFGRNVLSALAQVALNHDTNDTLLAGLEL